MKFRSRKEGEEVDEIPAYSAYKSIVSGSILLTAWTIFNYLGTSPILLSIIGGISGATLMREFRKSVVSRIIHLITLPSLAGITYIYQGWKYPNVIFLFLVLTLFVVIYEVFHRYYPMVMSRMLPDTSA